MCCSAHLNDVSYFHRSEGAVYTYSRAQLELQKPLGLELLPSFCAIHKPSRVTETCRPDERCCNTHCEFCNLTLEWHRSKGHLSEMERKGFNVISKSSNRGLNIYNKSWTLSLKPIGSLSSDERTDLKLHLLPNVLFHRKEEKDDVGAFCSGVNLYRRTRGTNITEHKTPYCFWIVTVRRSDT